MIKNRTYSNTQIVTEFSLPENQTVKRILLFLKNILPEFESDFTTEKPDIHLEDDISEQLLYYFQVKAKQENLLFSFNSKKGVDFRIQVAPFKLGTPPIFIIEAKRLSGFHYDYVKGETGGIERFKREYTGFGKHLSNSAMIGYIQEQNKEHWLKKINFWIDGLINRDSDIIWTEKDKLVTENKYSHFISEHLRISGTSITLYHFWISLN